MKPENKIKKGNPIKSYWKSMSLVKKLALILGLIVAVPLIALIAFQLRLSITTNAAKGKVDNARLSIEMASDQKFDAMVKAVKSAGLNITETSTSKYDVCYISSNDRGWFAYNHYQDCYLRYVNGYKTDANKSQIYQLAHANPDIFKDIKDSEYDQQVSPCLIAEDNVFELLRFVTPQTQNAQPQDCGKPDPIEGVSSMSGPAEGIVIKKRSGTTVTAQTNDAAQNQLWIQLDMPYYHEDLGCGIGLFCESPRANASLKNSVRYERY
ncbi:hypothetical protein BH09PAT3_BH09PAT3_4920 [soil metagenome]